MLTIFQNSKHIWNWRFKLEKGTLSGNLYFHNYSEFCIETSKTQNTKVVHLDKIYNFAFELNFKFFLVFELHKRGQIQGFKIRVSPLKLSENFYPRVLITNTNIHTQYKHTLIPKHIHPNQTYFKLVHQCVLNKYTMQCS